MSTVPLPNIEARARAARRARLLQYLTIAWNSAECAVALVAGFPASSIALVGFGFDSAIEVTSGLAALWRLRWDADEERRESSERLTLRIIGACFLLLAVYVICDAVEGLSGRYAPEHSVIGIVLASGRAPRALDRSILRDIPSYALDASHGLALGGRT